jgi:NAD(P)-dependent dehydrogenase (short-subunit alcohol dehydrogenase family)
MKTWFITGTSSGFGRIMTEELVNRGDQVAATLRHPEQLDELRAQAGDRLWTAELDVTRPDDVRRVVDEAFAHFGRIDVVVSNAGYGLYAAIEEPSREQVQRVIDTDLMGPIDVIRAALPHLRAQGGGRILQVSSAGGQTTYPGFGIYHAAKWGVEGFCETLAAEVAQFGIGVTIAEPGATPTRFSAGKDTAPAMTEYDGGEFGAARRIMAEGRFRGPNDAAAIAAAMIASADGPEAPLRLPLGTDTYHDLHAAYEHRLKQLEAGREVALSVVADSLPGRSGHLGRSGVLEGVVTR